jgi:hypothetical protein
MPRPWLSRVRPTAVHRHPVCVLIPGLVPLDSFVKDSHVPPRSENLLSYLLSQPTLCLCLFPASTLTSATLNINSFGSYVNHCFSSSPPRHLRTSKGG